MTKFGELKQFYDPGLTLTVDGKEYTIPLPSAELGLAIKTTMALAGEYDPETTTDDEMKSLIDRIAALPEVPDKDRPWEYTMLGSALDQMIADGQSYKYIEICAETAFWWILLGDDAAREHWESGGRPERLARGNRAQRRAATTRGTTPGAAASTTRQPDSGSGTNPHPKRSNRRRRGR